MLPKRIVLVARDIAPSACFVRLATVFKKRGFNVDLIAGVEKILITPIEQIIKTAQLADIVMAGMSSSAELAEPEIIACQSAQQNDIPYGFYGDVPRCWARARSGAWFEKLAKNTGFYFGVTETDAKTAKEIFPKAECIGTGNPLREEMAFPVLTRQEVRKILKINPDEKLVLAVGGKFVSGHIAQWVIVIEALSLLVAKNGENNQHFQLFLAPHPGDRTLYAIDPKTQKEMNLYQELTFFSPIPTKIVDKDILTSSQMVPGADIIIEFGSSIGIEGAYQNIPTITLGLEVLFQRHEQISGTRLTEAIEDGFSELVTADATKLASKIKKLLTPQGFAPLRARQQELFPKPTQHNTALKRMADAIEKILKSKTT